MVSTFLVCAILGAIKMRRNEIAKRTVLVNAIRRQEFSAMLERELKELEKVPYAKKLARAKARAAPIHTKMEEEFNCLQ